ncbi:Rho guanyl nucleotide exchange factor [Penicillium waksmanii]|uniref:Rho guanyl nucleotide exchange factor n=1 Tax=Penicillium waksmanii TaxID=69791 RepID=UPI002547B4E9|nr:Rho guanyl nucleotide exchange factor [Penicillium waksmanii]KAJ5976310.1 Rho guanyl nucleotide exchange factor [Penicillium waksmanii]
MGWTLGGTMIRGDADDADDTPESKRLLLAMKEKPEATRNEQDQGLFPKPAPNLPFKKWMDSFRTRKRIPPTIPERFVAGWPDSPPSDISTQNQFPFPALSHEQHWERSSNHSSHLGTVKTTTLSIASPSVARSRANTQSTTSQNGTSPVRASADSSRPTSSTYVDEAAEQRATKRRQLLREVLSTEADYVQGLTALTGVDSAPLYFNYGYKKLMKSKGTPNAQH